MCMFPVCVNQGTFAVGPMVEEQELQPRPPLLTRNVMSEDRVSCNGTGYHVMSQVVQNQIFFGR